MKLTRNLKLYWIIVFIVLSSWLVISRSHVNAIVNTYKGLSIFIESVPVDNYRQLGIISLVQDSVDAYTTFSQAQFILDKAKHDYPAADGVIITDLNFHSATVIKFK